MKIKKLKRLNEDNRLSYWHGDGSDSMESQTNWERERSSRYSRIISALRKAPPADPHAWVDGKYLDDGYYFKVIKERPTDEPVNEEAIKKAIEDATGLSDITVSSSIRQKPKKYKYVKEPTVYIEETEVTVHEEQPSNESLDEAVKPFVDDNVLGLLNKYEYHRLPSEYKAIHIDKATRVDQLGTSSGHDPHDVIKAQVTYDTPWGEEFVEKTYRVYDNGKVEEIDESLTEDTKKFKSVMSSDFISNKSGREFLKNHPTRRELAQELCNIYYGGGDLDEVPWSIASQCYDSSIELLGECLSKDVDESLTEDYNADISDMDLEEVEEINSNISLCSDNYTGKYYIVDNTNQEILAGGTTSLKKAKQMADDVKEYLSFGESLTEASANENNINTRAQKEYGKN